MDEREYGHVYREECIDGVVVHSDAEELVVSDGENSIVIPVDYTLEFASVIEEASNAARLAREMDTWTDES